MRSRSDAVPEGAPTPAVDADVPAARVSALELFFDLVFVFTVTQVTRLVAHAHGAADLLRAFLILAVTWWMYGGYAWLTNNVATEATAIRVMLLGGMAGFLVMALSIPGVAGPNGVAFGLAYLAVIVVHAALFTRASHAPARAIFGIARFNLASAALVVAAGLAPPTWNLPLWAAALLAPLTSTLVRAERGFSLRAGHFAERHGLIILIALGESVTGVREGAEALPVRLPVAGAAVASLALAAGIWWSYFDGDDLRAEQAMARADGPERARLGLQAYWFAHLVMIAGIVGTAVGVQGAVAGLARSDPSVAARGATWGLAAGVALYLAGAVVFRRLLRLGPVRVRAATAGLALATAPIGEAAGNVAQLVTLVALLAALVASERYVAARQR